MVRYFVWCLAFCFDSVVKPLKLLKTKAMKNICVQYSTFHPAGFWTTTKNFSITLFDTRKLHTWQPPEYKSMETSRNLCIVRMSLKTMSRNNLQKSLKRHSEGPGDLIFISSVWGPRYQAKLIVRRVPAPFTPDSRPHVSCCNNSPHGVTASHVTKH